MCMCVFFSLFCVSIFTLVAFAIDYLSRVFLTGVLRTVVGYDIGCICRLSVPCVSHWCAKGQAVVGYDIGCICRLSVPCVSHWCAKGQWLVMTLVVFVDYLSRVFPTGVLLMLRDSGW